MRIRALRQHLSTVGFHVPGTESAEYEDTKANAEYKIARGIVEEVKAKKAEAPENKKAAKPSNKAD